MALARVLGLGLRVRTSASALVVQQTKSLFTSRSVLAAQFPNRVSSSFFIYSQEIRPKVVQENPNLTAPEVVEEVARRFNALSEEDRQKYEHQAAVDRERYLKEMEKYRQSINVRPRGLHMNTQLKAIAQERGINPTLSALASISQTLSPEDKQRLREERRTSLVAVREKQEEWDMQHKTGLAYQKELEAKFLFRKNVRNWFDEARKRRWKSVSSFPRKYVELTDEQKTQVKALKREHQKKARRVIKRALRDKGFADEAESI
eukprot:m.7521 g.7521  ORF g.7521 m.7521 type:complete len:262 (+) comp5238_c0_seq1:218-1003(+)